MSVVPHPSSRSLSVAVLVCVLALSAGACSGGDDGADVDVTTSSSPTETTDEPATTDTPDTSDTSDTSTPAASDEEFPCNLLTPDEVAQITGNPLDGDTMSGPVSEGELSWNAEQCVWTGAPSSTAMEVTYSVSRAEDFPSGASTCPPPLAASTPVTGVGDSATWSWDDPGTTQKVGELRVCSASSFLVVRVSGTQNEAQQQQAATSIAQKALAAL